MQLGADLSKFHCARCQGKLSVPAHFQDGFWWHTRCWQEGEHQLAAANKIIGQAKRMHDLYPLLVFLTEPNVL